MSSPIAIVTGVAGGIGSAACTTLRSAGRRVVGVDLNLPEGDVCDLFVRADLAEVGSDESACQRLVSRLQDLADGSPIDLLVNNAAIQVLGPTREIAVGDWLRTLYVNLSAPFLLARGLADDLAAARGAIINIGSVHAQATKPGFSAYSTSKAALHGLTRALAIDLAPKVRVLTLAPAAVATSMLRAGFEGRPEAFEALEGIHPVGRVAAPDEIGRAVAWLASDAAGFMTGSTIWMDGGILSCLHDPVQGHQ